MIDPVGILAFFGAIADPLATNAIFNLLVFLKGRLLNLASVASLDLDHVFKILFGIEITAGQSFELFRLHPFRVGGLLVSPRPFIVKIFAWLGDGVLKVVERVRGFGVFEKPSLPSVDQPILLKLDFPFDIVGQNPHRSARDELAILDQAARVVREIKGIRGGGDEAIVGDELRIPAAAKDCPPELTDTRRSKDDVAAGAKTQAFIAPIVDILEEATLKVWRGEFASLHSPFGLRGEDADSLRKLGHEGGILDLKGGLVKTNEVRGTRRRADGGIGSVKNRLFRLQSGEAFGNCGINE